MITAFLITGVRLQYIDLDGFRDVPIESPDDNFNITLKEMKFILAQVTMDYDKRLRPRIWQGESVVVNTTYSLDAVVNFDTTGQVVAIMGYFTVNWYDDLLTWNSSEFNGSNMIKVRLQEIWYPNIVIVKVCNHIFNLQYLIISNHSPGSLFIDNRRVVMPICKSYASRNVMCANVILRISLY